MLNRQTAKLFAVLMENFPPIDDERMQWYIEHSKDLRFDLGQALDCFSVFRIINHGARPQNTDDLIELLGDAEGGLGLRWINHLLLNSRLIGNATSPVRVALVAPTVADLGYKRDMLYDVVCRSGRDLDYRDCTLEIMVDLFSQLRGDIGDGFLIPCMNPFPGPDGEHFVLAIRQWPESGLDFVPLLVSQLLCRPQDRIVFVSNRRWQ